MKKRFSSTLQRNLVIILSASMLLTALLWIGQDYLSFQRESKKLQQDYIASQQALISEQLNRAARYVESQVAAEKQRLRNVLVARASAVWRAVQSFYEECQTDQSPDRVARTSFESSSLTLAGSPQAVHFIRQCCVYKVWYYSGAI